MEKCPIAHLPPGEGSSSPLAIVHPSSEGNQASGSLPSLAIALLPPGEGSNFSQELYTFPWKMTALPRPLFSFPQGKKTIPPRLLLSSHIGREIAPLNPPGPPRQGKAIIPPGWAGKVIGTPQAQAHTAFPGGQCNLLGRQPHLHTPQ